jgi:hypothetical protein
MEEYSVVAAYYEKERDMWNPATIGALCTSVAAVIGAATVLVRQLQHLTDPNAHQVDPSTHEHP